MVNIVYYLDIRTCIYYTIDKVNTPILLALAGSLILLDPCFLSNIHYSKLITLATINVTYVTRFAKTLQLHKFNFTTLENHNFDSEHISLHNFRILLSNIRVILRESFR